VTIPSQRRYVAHFLRELGCHGGGAQPPRPLLLRAVRLNLPASLARGCTVSVLPRHSDPATGLELPCGGGVAAAAGGGPQLSGPLHVDIPAAPGMLSVGCITGGGGPGPLGEEAEGERPPVACSRAQSSISFLSQPSSSPASDTSARRAAAAGQGGAAAANAAAGAAAGTTAALPPGQAVFCGDIKVQLARGGWRRLRRERASFRAGMQQRLAGVAA
jgi:hypothetical protein